jgi:hypothetical protein
VIHQRDLDRAKWGPSLAPLAQFIGYVAIEAIETSSLLNRPATEDALQMAVRCVRQQIDRYASRGAFLFFRIVDRLDLPDLSCDVRLFRPTECPTCYRSALARLGGTCGHVTVDAWTIATEILYAARRLGWYHARGLTADDLAKS